MSTVEALKQLGGPPDIEKLQQRAKEAIQQKLDIRASSLGNMSSVLEHAAQRAEESQHRLAQSESRMTELLQDARGSAIEMNDSAMELGDELRYVESELIRQQQEDSQAVYDELTNLLAWRDTLSGTYTVLSSLAQVEALCGAMLNEETAEAIKATYLQVCELCHTLAATHMTQASLMPVVEISVAMVQNAWTQVLLRWQTALSDELTADGWPRTVPSYDSNVKNTLGDLLDMECTVRRNPLPVVELNPALGNTVNEMSQATLSTPQPRNGSILTATEHDDQSLDVAALAQNGARADTEVPYDIGGPDSQAQSLHTQPYALTPPEALRPLVQPLILRFKYSFEGTRPSNRLDKPEFAFDFALELIRNHIGYIIDTVQPLANERGVNTDCSIHFVTMLLEPVLQRTLRHAHQMIESQMPNEYDHLVDQLLAFDSELRALGYHGSVEQITKSQLGIEVDTATSAVTGHQVSTEDAEPHSAASILLDDPELFTHWLNVERDQYLESLNASLAEPDSWTQIPSHKETLFPAAMQPTWAAQRLADLGNQMITRINTLAARHAKPYTTDVFIPIISHFQTVLVDVYDSANSNTLGLDGLAIQGGATNAGAFAGGLDGTHGDMQDASMPIQRIIRFAAIYITALWIRDKSFEWADDPSLICVSPDVDVLSHVRRDFVDISKRSADCLVHLLFNTLLDNLQFYIRQNWDYTFADPNDPDAASQVQPPIFDHDLDLSNPITHPVNIWTQIWSNILALVPPLVAQMWYDRVAIQLGEALYTRFVLQAVWSYPGARQVLYDWQHGIVGRASSTGIPQAERGWRVLLSALLIVSLPPGPDTDDQHTATFPEIMQVAYDPATLQDPSHFRALMDQLNVPSSFEPAHVQALLKRRPEAWR